MNRTFIWILVVLISLQLNLISTIWANPTYFEEMFESGSELVMEFENSETSKCYAMGSPI